MLRHLKRAADPPPLAPARARQETFDWVASAYAVARGLVGDVRAATGCRTLLSVCHPVCNRLSQPPFPRSSPQVTSEALPSPMPRRLSRPRSTVLRAAPAGLPQRAGGGGHSRGASAKSALNFLSAPHKWVKEGETTHTAQPRDTRQPDRVAAERGEITRPMETITNLPEDGGDINVEDIPF